MVRQLALILLVCTYVVGMPTTGAAQRTNKSSLLVENHEGEKMTTAHESELERLTRMLAQYRPLKADPTSLTQLDKADHSNMVGLGIELSDPRTIRVTPITFTPYSTEVDTAFHQWLIGVARSMQENPAMLLRIEAHTDDIGTEQENLLLSFDRATVVQEHLYQLGVTEGRTSATGYGERFPIATNSTREGRHANRRVEFRVSLLPKPR